MSGQVNIFGEIEHNDPLLRDKFIEPPFSILDTKSGSWQRRKRLWKSIGLKSEVGRDAVVLGLSAKAGEREDYVSIFDPALCEVIYHWFCPEGGNILDPFAGGSVRGIVANYLGYKYTGIDIREEQILSNKEQGLDILGRDNLPLWLVGDSDVLLDTLGGEYDFLFSCPPYADLEVYSDLAGDISNMNYKEFLEAYDSIIYKSSKLLKSGSYACFVVGEVRDKKGNYIGFVPDTISSFRKAGLEYYNEAILLNAIASASLRANHNMKNKKLVKVHQNVLIFKKQ